MGMSSAARQLFLVLEPALGSPLIQDLLARCTPQQDLVAPVGLPLIATRAHRHAVELLRIGVAEQPSLTAKRANAIVLVPDANSLPRRAGSGARRLAAGARRRARVVVERAGRHRHLGPQSGALELVLVVRARHRHEECTAARILVSYGHRARAKKERDPFSLARRGRRRTRAGPTRAPCAGVRAFHASRRVGCRVFGVCCPSWKLMHPR